MLTWDLARRNTGTAIAHHPERLLYRIAPGETTPSRSPLTMAMANRASDHGRHHRRSPPTRRRVVVDAPTTGETVAGGALHHPLASPRLAATRSHASTSSRRRTTQRTFTPIAECAALAASAQQCVWQHPAPPSNTEPDQGDRHRYSRTQLRRRFAAVHRARLVRQHDSAAAGRTPTSATSLQQAAPASTARSGPSAAAAPTSGTPPTSSTSCIACSTTQLVRAHRRRRVDTVQNVHPWTKAGLDGPPQHRRQRAARLDLRLAGQRRRVPAAPESPAAPASARTRTGDHRARLAAADRR